MQETDSKKIELKKLLAELNDSVLLSKRKYFHPNTIENFIFHFDEIKTETDKNWVYETLTSYFKICLDLIHSSEPFDSIDSKTSKILWYDYIDKLTDYYEKNLGFDVLINRAFVYFVYLIVLTLCSVFFNFYVVLLVASFFIFQIYKAYKKYSKKQVYGLYW